MNAVNWPVYLGLCAMFSLEYIVWGAWMPVLAARLLGPLKMSGKQTGWIYAAMPLASLVAYPLGGYLADKYVDAKWIMVLAHAVGAVLLYLAAKTEKFGPLFFVMLVYSLFYAATLPLANNIVFSHCAEAGVGDDKVFCWGALAWALVGWLLTGLRQMRITKSDGADALKLAAIASLAMVLACLNLPETRPQSSGTPILEAFSLLKEPNFLIFTLASVVVAGMMQFYFQGSAQFMQDIGISGKNVSATMGIAQLAQTAATFFLMNLLCTKIGLVWTLVIGAGCWALLYAAYIVWERPVVIVVSQGLHGLAYTFFIFVGWKFVAAVAPKDIGNSAQSLIWLATNGVGLFLGTQLAGVAMDKFSAGGKFQWKKVFAVPLLITLVGTIVLAAAVHDPAPAGVQKPAVGKAADQKPLAHEEAK